jgi:hypothetical protein
MSDEELRKLSRITQAGFDVLADLLRETNARVDANTAEMGRLTKEVQSLGGRFDNLVEIAGTETRRLRADVDALDRRVDALEKKAQSA